MEDLPLFDITVIDLSQFVSGPYCTRLLASFGAKVIKIEHPSGGDVSRCYGPFPHDIPDFEKSALFLYLNTNKKGITLDHSTKTGAKILKELIERADIVVENCRSQEIHSWVDIHPSLIAASISYFGQNGPYHHFKGSDIVAQALGGIMKLTGLPDREPLKIVGPQAEYQAGINSAAAIMMALQHRDLTGQGQFIDISVMECLASILEGALLSYAYDGSLRQRDGSRHPTVYPSNILPCKDGYVHVDSSTDWETFATYMEMPELLQFDRNEIREKADEIDFLIASRLAQHTRDEIFHSAQEWRLPFARVMGVNELINDSQFIDRNFFIQIDHPIAGAHVYPGAPFKMSGCQPKNERAPLLGEHNIEVYCDLLGYTKDDVVRLHGMGVI